MPNPHPLYSRHNAINNNVFFNTVNNVIMNVIINNKNKVISDTRIQDNHFS